MNDPKEILEAWYKSIGVQAEFSDGYKCKNYINPKYTKCGTTHFKSDCTNNTPIIFDHEARQ